jgi:hypothetical protein
MALATEQTQQNLDPFAWLHVFKDRQPTAEPTAQDS